MNDSRFKELLNKLSTHIDGVDPSVSPTLGSGRDKAVMPGPLFITSEMDVTDLSKNDLYLAHVLLHLFYGRGGNKSLSRHEIEELHNEVKTKINHSPYDRLDEK